MRIPSFTVKRVALAGGAAALIGTAAIGAAAAQTPQPAPPAETRPARGPQAMQDHHQKVLDAAASRLGVSADRLRQALEEARREVGPLPRPTGPGGPFGPGGLRDRVQGAARAGLQTAANAIGISVDDLRRELATGKSLADVATARGKQPSAVADALKAEANARVDQAVAQNRLPADRAAQLKQRLAEGIDRLMTRQGPPRGSRGPDIDRTLSVG